MERIFYGVIILEGTEERGEEIQKETDEDSLEDQEKEQELSEEKFKAQMKKLKKRKAKGEDGIENEAWLYAPTEIKKDLKNLLKDIWRNKKIPEKWKVGTISLIFKKAEKN